MKLTQTQKLHALAYRFYQGAAWTPKAGDFYTTSRADLELYQVVSIEDGIVRTRYTEGTDAISEWQEAGFLTEGFGPKRVFVPEWVMNLRAIGADHPDSIAVDRFADAMKAKLAQKRAEGRGGWDDKERCTAEFLSELLRDHVRKGDPVDVGNLAMMLHQRGEVIASDAALESFHDELKGYALKSLLATPPADEWLTGDRLTPEEAWTILCETPDITSPEEYPDHALIKLEQLRGFMERAAPPPADLREENERLRAWGLNIQKGYIEAKTENDQLKAGIKRLSDEEEICSETTGEDPYSLVYLAAKLAAAEASRDRAKMLGDKAIDDVMSYHASWGWLVEALTQSQSTEAEYTGAVRQRVTMTDPSGVEYSQEIVVDWPSIKAVMNIILARAARKGAAA